MENLKKGQSEHVNTFETDLHTNQVDERKTWLKHRKLDQSINVKESSLFSPL